MVELGMALRMSREEVGPPVYFNLAIAHAMAGHCLEAVASLREFLQRYASEETRRQRAHDLLRRLGEQE
jgi:hypothetical protein